MKTLAFVLGIFCLGLLLPACKESTLYPDDANPEQGGGKALTITDVIGKGWLLESYEVVGGAITPIKDTALFYIIVFDDTASFRAVARYANIRGGYTTVDSHRIFFHNTVLHVENGSYDLPTQDFMDGLKTAESYKATATSLRIFYDGAAKVMNFVPWPGDASKKDSTLSDVIGMQWQLDSMVMSRDDGVSRKSGKIPADQLITLKFNDHTGYVGTANCNIYRGYWGYVIEADRTEKTVVSTIDTSTAECGIENPLEHDYYRKLRHIHTYDLVMGEHPRLTFYDAAGGFLLNFIPKPAPVPQLNATTLEDLAGTHLVLLEYGPTYGQRSIAPNKGLFRPQLTILGDRQIIGGTFCGLFSCRYMLGAGNAMEVPTWMNRPRFNCRDAEPGLMAALDSISSYAIKTDRLELYYDNGNSVLVFVKN